MSVADVVPIDPVIELHAECSDSEDSEALLSAALAGARGPRRSAANEGRWQLTMSITTAAPGIKLAEAEIKDDRGHVVAERSVSDRTTGSCLALVRAVGA